MDVIENDVILLRPPPDYPITAQLEELSIAMKEYNLDRVIFIWSHLVDLGAISRFDSITFKYISEFIADILHRRGSPNLNKLAAISPEKYGLLLNMSIESAARDHISGFFFILLRLLEIGRPGDVVNAFNTCKVKMRELQGKDANDLLSWDREKRLAARLEGEGLRSLMMVNIAALTLLDQCDEAALFGMLDATADLRPNSKFNFAPIHRSLSRANVSNKQHDLYSQFRQNVDKLILALQCYHPNAFVHRITIHGRAKTFGALNKLYQQVLEATVGPDAFVKVRNLGDHSAHFQSSKHIPLPAIVWHQFLRAFEHRNDVDRIVSMIDTDLPLRNLRPDSTILSLAMVHMAIISTRLHLPLQTRQNARYWADEYWRRLAQNGWHMEDLAFSRRVRTLDILGRKEAQLKGEVDKLYDMAKAGHLSKIGRQTRAAFVESFMARNDIKQTLDVFKMFPHNPSAEQHDFTPAVSAFIRLLATRNYTANKSFTFCARILKLVAQTGTPIETSTLGPLLSIQLNAGLPIQPAVDTILSHSLTPTHPIPGINKWTRILTGLLTKWSHCRPATKVELEAGLYILSKARDEDLYGRKREREYDLWLAFLRPAAKTTSLNNEERYEIIETAMSLFPRGGKGKLSTIVWFEVVHALVTRPDGLGFGEGWARWCELVKIRELEGIWWDRMLRTIVRINHNFAVNLVRSAWEHGNTKVRVDEAFWMRAEAEGLVKELGIEQHLEKKRNGLVEGKSWRQNLVTHMMEEDDDMVDWDMMLGKEEVIDEVEAEYGGDRKSVV